MSESELKKLICELGKRMYDSGFVAANDGNISVRAGDRIITTPTGVSKGFMTPDMMVTVDIDGNVLGSSNQWRASSELKMHLKVYRDRPDVMAVVHAHPPYATTFAVAHLPLTRPLIAEAVVTLGCVPVAAYGTPSTEEVPAAISEYLNDFDAILLANHGALAWGDSLVGAYHKMESLEFYAKLTFLAMQQGSPQELSNEQVERLYGLRNKMGINGRHPSARCGPECKLPCNRVFER